MQILKVVKEYRISFLKEGETVIDILIPLSKTGCGGLVSIGKPFVLGVYLLEGSLSIYWEVMKLAGGSVAVQSKRLFNP
jgi:hypothetical protein